MIDPGKGLGSFIDMVGVAVASLCILTGCDRPVANQVQGYIEGEFIYVSSPLAGTLETLSVVRGDRVTEGDPLFTLEDTPEKAALDETERRLAQARATFEDLKKGRRPSEIEALEAQLRQQRAALRLAEKELERQERISRVPGATSEQEKDRARSTRDQGIQRVAQIEADLKTARLGSRADQVEAAGANVKAVEAALSKAKWDLSQKERAAPRSGLVFNTIYRPGEWVAAGRPVVSLLPPENIKVRAFVPETMVGGIQPGTPVRVLIDGADRPVSGKISFISPQAEYTPPVIYSRENRTKLVFMVEAVVDPEAAINLHPGQPVDVRFGS